MPEFVLNRTHVLTTTSGHIVNFAKGEPVYVPPCCVAEAVAIGAERVDAVQEPLLPPEDIKAPTYTGDQREAMIFLAFDVLVERNRSTDFTAQGVPSAGALRNETGLEVDSKERQALWMKYRALKAGQ